MRPSQKSQAHLPLEDRMDALSTNTEAQIGAGTGLIIVKADAAATVVMFRVVCICEQLGLGPVLIVQAEGPCLDQRR